MFEAYAPIGSPSRPFKEDSEPVVIEDPVIKAIADKHNATPVQVLYYAHKLSMGILSLAQHSQLTSIIILVLILWN